MTQPESRPIDQLLAVMARLRHPTEGCPWDREQNYCSIVPHTIEEAYEVADAIEQNDMLSLKDELGDLLFQVVYYAQMASEDQHFTFDDVARAIVDKMVSRHPHVFGADSVATAAAQTVHWEAQKAAERQARAQAEGQNVSALDGVARGLPALTRALKLQKRAARVGFDWPDALQILDKIEEEVCELRQELRIAARAPAQVRARMADELGDVFFALVNLARHLELDPEAALRGCNAKFERRFHYIEQQLAQQALKPEDVGLDVLEALWQDAKQHEHC